MKQAMWKKSSYMRSDQFDSPFLQPPPQRVAAVGLVGDLPLRFLPQPPAPAAIGDADRGECDFREFDFRRRGQSQVLSQTNTRPSVDDFPHNPKVAGSNPAPATKKSTTYVISWES
jgi:hypothetical protein